MVGAGPSIHAKKVSINTSESGSTTVGSRPTSVGSHLDAWTMSCDTFRGITDSQLRSFLGFMNKTYHDDDDCRIALRDVFNAYLKHVEGQPGQLGRDNFSKVLKHVEVGPKLQAGCQNCQRPEGDL